MRWAGSSRSTSTKFSCRAPSGTSIRSTSGALNWARCWLIALSPSLRAPESQRFRTTARRTRLSAAIASSEARRTSNGMLRTRRSAPGPQHTITKSKRRRPVLRSQSLFISLCPQQREFVGLPPGAWPGCREIRGHRNLQVAENSTHGRLMICRQFFICYCQRVKMVGREKLAPASFIVLQYVNEMVNGAKVKPGFSTLRECILLTVLLAPCPGLQRFPERDGLAELIMARNVDIARMREEGCQDIKR